MIFQGIGSILKMSCTEIHEGDYDFVQTMAQTEGGTHNLDKIIKLSHEGEFIPLYEPSFDGHSSQIPG